MAARKVSPQVREGRERALVQNQGNTPRRAIFAVDPVVPPAKEGPEFRADFQKRSGAQSEAVLDGNNLGELKDPVNGL